MTIKEAVRAALEDWASQYGGTTPDLESMVEQANCLVDEAILEWAEENGYEEVDGLWTKAGDSL